MDKAERAQLIRTRFKAKGGLRWVLGEPRPKAPERSTVRCFGPAWLMVSNGGHVKAWVKEPDAGNAGVTPQTRRTARKHALTKIAEQLPAKLPRVLF